MAKKISRNLLIFIIVDALIVGGIAIYFLEKSVLPGLFSEPPRPPSAQSLIQEIAELPGQPTQTQKEGQKENALQEAEYEKAKNLYLNSQHEQSIEILKDLIESSPNYAKAHRLLSENLLVSAQDVAADREAFESLKTALQIDPADEESLFNLLSFIEISSHKEAARELLQETAEINAEAAIAFGRQLFQENNQTEGLRLLEDWANREPQNEKIIRELSLRHFETNRFETALQWIDEWKQMDVPEDLQNLRYDLEFQTYLALQRDPEEVLESWELEIPSSPTRSERKLYWEWRMRQ